MVRWLCEVVFQGAEKPGQRSRSVDLWPNRSPPKIFLLHRQLTLNISKLLLIGLCSCAVEVAGEPCTAALPCQCNGERVERVGCGCVSHSQL